MILCDLPYDMTQIQVVWEKLKQTNVCQKSITINWIIPKSSGVILGTGMSLRHFWF